MYEKNIESSLLLSSYLPNIHYFTKLVGSKKIFIEQEDNFVKQTYRNRCDILTTDGLRSLTVPINRMSGKFKTKDTVIDYSTKWQQLHWKSILSAYNSSPFFEYYQDEFHKIFFKESKFLIDFNESLLNLLIKLIDFNPCISFTKDYIPTEIFNGNDYRELISPKSKEGDKLFQPQKYYQVFNKDGFIPNLSVIDLLFNEGNNSLSILLGSIASIQE